MRKQGSLFCVILALFLFASFRPSRAADICCYTPDEVKAEQLLRLHSKLMVIAVTCRQGSQGQNLGTAYADFTKKNIGMLRDAEQTMKQYYRKHHGGDGIKQLDRLRTLLANEYGQQLAAVSAPVFCAQQRDNVIEMNGATPAALVNEASRLGASPYDPPCTALLSDASP